MNKKSKALNNGKIPVIGFEEVSRLVRYNAYTGKLYWINDARCGFGKSVVSHLSGDEAGTPRASDGRFVVRLDGKLYLRYRVAWLLEYGCWPSLEVDHIDGDPTNDKIENLRLASRTLNQENIRAPIASKKSSAYLGVYANKAGRSMPWIAKISSGGKEKYLGAFSTEEEAYSAYVDAKRVIHKGCTI